MLQTQPNYCRKCVASSTNLCLSGYILIEKGIFYIILLIDGRKKGTITYITKTKEQREGQLITHLFVDVGTDKLASDITS